MAFDTSRKISIASPRSVAGFFEWAYLHQISSHRTANLGCSVVHSGSETRASPTERTCSRPAMGM
eukprot:2706261-Karenia_brevis.AAC.1